MSLTERLSLIKPDQNDEVDIGNITDSFDLLDDPQYVAALVADVIQRIKVNGDTDPRWRIKADGQQEWGDGTGAPDVTLKRSAAGELEVDGDLKVSGKLGALPSGTLTMFAGDTQPAGWLFCDGSEVDRTVYADLFAAIGTTYGEGDAVTTFNLPDLQGKFPVGIKGADPDFDVLGDTGGEKTHTLVTGEMPAHTHAIEATGNDMSIADGTSAMNNIKVGSTATGRFSADPNAIRAATTGGGAAHNNLPPFIAVNFIIKI